MRNKFTKKDFDKMFHTNDDCLEWIKNQQYPNGIECPTCKKITKHHKISKRPVYECDYCGHQISPLATTIFCKSTTPLRVWFGAIYEMATTRSGYSAKALQRKYGVTYKTAWRMFKERPFFGWGPGTYMFKYAPFQLEREKTEISTNAADLGNAHSEYIGPLSESGFPGMLSFLSIVILTIITGVRCWFHARNRKVRILSLSLLLGLITYYLHGLLNNFLDTDKASALFWGFTAAIVSIDIYHRDRQKR